VSGHDEFRTRDVGRDTEVGPGGQIEVVTLVQHDPSLERKRLTTSGTGVHVEDVVRSTTDVDTYLAYGAAHDEKLNVLDDPSTSCRTCHMDDVCRWVRNVEGEPECT